MSLSRPRAALTVDGRRLTSAQAALVRLHAWLSLDGTHDRVELMVWPSSKLASVRSGAKLGVALGEDGQEADVWSGEVTAVAAHADGVVIEGLAATVALSRRRLSQTYLDQSVADIVRDLAGSAVVDQVEGDTNLSAYVVDDRRSVWSHLLDLAALVGADVGASAAGGLRFTPARTGSANAKLRYRADVVSWSGGNAPEPDAPGVAAYGAASESGADQWHWILRSPTASGGAGGPLLVVPALRTRDAADAMSRALASRAQRAGVRGRLRTPGRGGARPGDLVEVSDLPSGDLGTLRVLAVEHVLDARTGFVTTLTVEGAQ